MPPSLMSRRIRCPSSPFSPGETPSWWVGVMVAGSRQTEAMDSGCQSLALGQHIAGHPGLSRRQGDWPADHFVAQGDAGQSSESNSLLGSRDLHSKFGGSDATERLTSRMEERCSNPSAALASSLGQPFAQEVGRPAAQHPECCSLRLNPALVASARQTLEQPVAEVLRAEAGDSDPTFSSCSSAWSRRTIPGIR